MFFLNDETRQHKSQASVTVETALVFPLFLVAVLLLLSFLDIFRLHSNIDAGLHQTARKMAVYGYAAGQSSAVQNLLSGVPGSVAFNESYVRKEVLDYVGRDYLDNAPIRGGSGGVSFVRGRIMENQMICLAADYQAVPMIAFPGFARLFPRAFSLSSQYKIRAFTGYDNAAGSVNGDGEEMVFLAETGTVYHRSRDCTHLALSVSVVSRAELDTRRNEGGGIYHPCELCGGGGAGSVYITDHGSRYHSSTSCSGLKRTVTVVPLSQVGGRRACSRCG